MKNFKAKALIFAMLFLSAFSADKAYADIYAEKGTYKESVDRWTRSINSSTFKSTSWIWNLERKDELHKNKRRDSILVVPETAKAEDITLVVWFHGLNGFSEKGFKNRIIPQLEYLVGKDSSIALAIPEMPWSVNTSSPRGRQGRVWLRKGELERYVKEIKEYLDVWALVFRQKELGQVRLIFIGHSAGGSAIMSASREGSLCSLKPDAIVWSDASYGYWLDSAWNGCIHKMSPETEAHILVRKWDKPHKNASRLMKRLKKKTYGPKIFYQVLDRRRWTHGRIGNSVFLLTDLVPPGC
jgi:hypothetical protein